MTKRWVCPTCNAGVHAPDRLRKLDTRRWCLRCSAQTGTLVERTIPSKAAAKVRQAAARIAKTTKHREQRAVAEAAATLHVRELAGAFDRDRRDAAAWLRAWTPRIVALSSLPDYHRQHYASRWNPSVQIRQGGHGRFRASGHAWPGAHRLCVTTGDAAADDLSTLIHELAHLAAPKYEHHGAVFQIIQRDAVRELTGSTIDGWLRDAEGGRVETIRQWLTAQQGNPG